MHTQQYADLAGFLDHLQEGMTIFSAVRNADGQIIDFIFEYINEAGSRFNKMTQAEHIGRRLLELFPLHANSPILEKYKEVVETGIPFRSESMSKLWRSRAYDLHAFKYKDGLGVSWRDISETVKTEEKFQMVFDRAPIGIATVGPDFRFTEVNAALQRILGYEHDELVGKSFVDITYPDDLNIDLENAKLLFAGKIQSYQIEKRYIRKDGSLLWIRLSGSLLLFNNGDSGPIALAMIEDIDDRKKTEVWLMESEQRFRKTFEEAPVGIEMFNQDGVRFLANRLLCKMYGRSSSEMIGASVEAQLHPEDLQIDREYRAKLVASKKSSYRHEKRILKSDGTLIWTRTKLSAVLDESGKFLYAIAVVIDITDQKILAEKLAAQQNILIQNSKMTALGQMASGISHEINNPLTVIYGSACLLTRLAKTPPIDAKKMLSISTDIEETSKRIEKIIDGLRAFSREGSHDPLESVPLTQVIESTLRFCEMRIIGHGIQLKYEPVSDTIEVRCRPTQISEILLNLLNNAHDAVLGQNDAWISLNVIDSSQKLSIRIADSGAGIPKEIREDMFQPFFTTKPVGEGTGLGLSISKGLAEANQGKLFYDKGSATTCFVLELPRKPTESNP